MDKILTRDRDEDRIVGVAREFVGFLIDESHSLRASATSQPL